MGALERRKHCAHLCFGTEKKKFNCVLMLGNFEDFFLHLGDEQQQQQKETHHLPMANDELSPGSYLPFSFVACFPSILPPPFP